MTLRALAVDIDIIIVMLKRFFVSFAGSLTAIWVSAFLFIILLVAMLAAAAMSNKNDGFSLKDHTILRIDLSGDIVERPTVGKLWDEIYAQEGNKSKLALNQVVNSILHAADDKSIEGIYLDCSGASAGIATRCQIVNALRKFKESGKWVYAYGDYYSQGDYLIATVADSVFVNPQGMVEVSGLSSTVMFFKNLLDKVGVEAQVIKVGTYKSAVEPFILDKMSEPSREQTAQYVNGIWNTLTQIISDGRGVTTDAVNLWADSLCVTWPVKKLIDNKIVDGYLYHHEMEELLAEKTDRIDVDNLRFVTPAQYAKARDLLNSKEGSHQIAVLYAVGDIVDTGSDGISAEAMVPEILDLAEDTDIDGLVLRVNSGGGSAFASEQIWEALEVFKSKGKPFYVSMGDVAASGGYYISCGADRIYAEPQTLTGSIGIFGIVPCAKTLLNDKIGITTSTVGTNANPTFLHFDIPMTPVEREAMQRRIDRGYETFVGRCAEGRGISVDSIKSIAEGRVWDGVTALKIGLVDEFGSLDDAVKAMAQELGLKKYSVGEYPVADLSFWQQLVVAQNELEVKIIEKHLGESYKIYTTIDRISRMEPVQCRMESVILR